MSTFRPRRGDVPEPPQLGSRRRPIGRPGDARAPGKEYGYIILPSASRGPAPEDALNDNQKYKVVWQVLQALRAHDDRFNAMINKIELKPRTTSSRSSAYPAWTPRRVPAALPQFKAAFVVSSDRRMARRHLRQDRSEGRRPPLLGDVGQGRRRDRRTPHHADQGALDGGDPDLKEVFAGFLDGLRSNLNDSITEDQAIEMLSQHSVTKPVFEALFEDYSFALTTRSRSLCRRCSTSRRANLEQEAESSSPSTRASVDEPRASTTPRASSGSSSSCTEVLQAAFPRAAESLGIVYTPVQIVDFIVRSVEHALKRVRRVDERPRRPHP